jgi:hypothetical protein
LNISGPAVGKKNKKQKTMTTRGETGCCCLELQDADSPHNTEGSREEEVVSGSIVK